MAATTSSALRSEPMRGISIIIESPGLATAIATAAAEAEATAIAAAAAAAATAATATQEAASAESESNTEMSPKSQAGMLLAFGDSAATTKDHLETSYDTTTVTAATTTTVTAAATATATATAANTKIYPQLLLRIGGEIGDAAATSPTIISCSGETASRQPASATEAAATAAAAAAATATVATSPHNNTVKIQIEGQGQPRSLGKQVSVVKLNEGVEEMQQQQQHHHHHLCFLVDTSGQYSPCETLDSGTGSDLEGHLSQISQISQIKQISQQAVRPPLLELHLQSTRLKVGGQEEQAGQQEQEVQRAYSLTDGSEEGDESGHSSLSCDSLHSGGLLPTSLLRDIRLRERAGEREREGRPLVTKIDGRPLQFEADGYYTFHVNEHASCRSSGASSTSSSSSSAECDAQEQAQAQAFPEEPQDEGFAGFRDVRTTSQPCASATIRSAKGTVRGVRNRVRSGVATFMQLQQPNLRSHMEKDQGKVVLYTTSMGIIRDTYAKCASAKQILRTLLVKFEERDVFMSVEFQQEMRERMPDKSVRVPQLFVEGQHIGDADAVERLNESGELRQMLKPYKSIATAFTCQTCGGYRMLPCPSCSGSKKSVHRNHFTAEFVALKCMNCDEVGLVKCPNC
ncbi:glutaredoxin domain-containing cysteine-rich protein CG12206 [Drosophila ficusphila]|uniref:glutaredoxin domain-containing cysteine-rich protein CG12206 n=1 Tax=Drosophila ficusphila TaxID=30025 RepID=UPI0007E728D3|nr:glutaredoxin domain-containing cysteine-rich protein CG12206 [Drosophila ficusphila]